MGLKLHDFNDSEYYFILSLTELQKELGIRLNHPYYRLKDSLTRPSQRWTSLDRLLRGLDQNRALLRAVRYSLTLEQARHCRSAMCRGTTVLVSVDSNSWANVIRFSAPKILLTLKQLSRFSHIDNVKIVTDSTFYSDENKS